MTPWEMAELAAERLNEALLTRCNGNRQAQVVQATRNADGSQTISLRISPSQRWLVEDEGRTAPGEAPQF